MNELLNLGPSIYKVVLEKSAFPQQLKIKAWWILLLEEEALFYGNNHFKRNLVLASWGTGNKRWASPLNFINCLWHCTSYKNSWWKVSLSIYLSLYLLSIYHILWKYCLHKWSFKINKLYIMHDKLYKDDTVFKLHIYKNNKVTYYHNITTSLNLIWWTNRINIESKFMHAFFKQGIYRSDSFKKQKLQIIYIKKL